MRVRHSATVTLSILCVAITATVVAAAQPASIAVTVNRLREMSPLYELAKEGVDLSTMQWEVH